MERFRTDIHSCVEVLNKGGIILYPTDTVWGIGCDATNAKAVEKIYQLKKRPDEKSMIILCGGKKQLLQYVTMADPKVFDFLKTVEKPTTVIYENAKGLAPNLIAKNGSVAIRICNEEFCRQLIKELGRPLVSTSANTSGLSAPASFGEIGEEIKKGVDYIVQYRQSDTTKTSPSTIIRWEGGKAILIRQ